MEKVKRPAYLRSFLFDANLFFRTMWQYVLVIAAFVLIYSGNDMLSPMWAGMMFGAIIPMAMQMQRYTLFYKQLVGFGLTKRNFILGGALSKPMYMLFGAVLIVLTGLIEKAPLRDIAVFLLIMTMVMLLTASYGDLAGAMILRWNRLGFVLYMILFVGCFFCVGVFMGIMSSSGMDQIAIMISPDYGRIALIVTIASVILSPLFHILAAILIDKVEVTS